MKHNWGIANKENFGTLLKSIIGNIKSIRGLALLYSYSGITECLQ